MFLSYSFIGLVICGVAIILIGFVVNAIFQNNGKEEREEAQNFNFLNILSKD